MRKGFPMVSSCHKDIVSGEFAWVNVWRLNREVEVGTLVLIETLSI